MFLQYPYALKSLVCSKGLLLARKYRKPAPPRLGECSVALSAMPNSENMKLTAVLYVSEDIGRPFLELASVHGGENRAVRIALNSTVYAVNQRKLS